MNLKRIGLLAGLAGLATLFFTLAFAQALAGFALWINPGDTGTIHCSGGSLSVSPLTVTETEVICLAEIVPTEPPAETPTPVDTPTAMPTDTVTATPTGTSTPTATATASAIPTLTAAPTATPTAVTPTPAASSLSFPIRATFFYPWFPQSWMQLGVFPYTNYHPSLGFYASSDDAIIDNQVAAMRYAHLDAAISSWWGQGHNTDSAFAHILTRAAVSPLRWSLYYEAEGQGNPTAATIASDLAYLSRYFGATNYLRVNGAPVLFVYGDPTDNCTTADRWKAAKALYGKPVYVVLKVFAGYAACASQPDAWHQYSPAVGYDQQGTLSAVVSPGFWKSGEAARLPRDLARFSADAVRVVASNAQWQLVTTWNEWGEGSGVEATQEWGTVYLDALCRAFPGPTPCGALSTPTPIAATPTSAPTLIPTQTPTAIPSPSGNTGDPVIAAAGDIACDITAAHTTTACRDAFTSNLLVNQGLAGVLTLGDNQYENGELANFNSAYASSWGRLFAITHPAIGNHEYNTTGGSGYYGYFGARAGDPAKGYYSFDIGAWHLISLNSECSHVGGCSAGSPQETWLKADLAAHPTACTLAYWHEPRFSSGQHGNNSAYAAFWNALYAAHAEIVLNGHDHDYERFGKQGPAAVADPNGIREWVVGTGGKNHYAVGTPVANSEVRNATTYGVLKLTLHPTAYDWQFMPEAGQAFTDQGSDTCRR
jgi:hypothetical protein